MPVGRLPRQAISRRFDSHERELLTHHVEPWRRGSNRPVLCRIAGDRQTGADHSSEGGGRKWHFVSGGEIFGGLRVPCLCGRSCCDGVVTTRRRAFRRHACARRSAAVTRSLARWLSFPFSAPPFRSTDDGPAGQARAGVPFVWATSSATPDLACPFVLRCGPGLVDGGFCLWRW